ncbi:MAG: LUD domain-containing protein [Bacteroidetes bacterium]|nr:LUD domain-containing protein [Bacteroidota bacterium]
MNVSASKENILKKIRQALSHPTNLPFPASEGVDSVFKPSQQELEFEFAERFTKLQGRFSFCENQQQLTEQLNTLITARNWQNIFCKEDILKQNLINGGFTNFNAIDLHSCDASITGCEQLIARTGSIVMSTAQQSGRTVSVYAPVHICIAYTNQLVYDIKDAITNVKEKYSEALPSLITLATGPSRTADIEKTLVVGVHGPKEVFCFLVEE